MSTLAIQGSPNHVQNLCDLYNPKDVNASSVTLAATMTFLSAITLGLVPAMAFSITGLMDHCSDKPHHEPASDTPTSLRDRLSTELANAVAQKPSLANQITDTRERIQNLFPRALTYTHTTQANLPLEASVRLGRELLTLNRRSLALQDNRQDMDLLLDLRRLERDLENFIR